MHLFGQHFPRIPKEATKLAVEREEVGEEKEGRGMERGKGGGREEEEHIIWW